MTKVTHDEWKEFNDLLNSLKDEPVRETIPQMYQIIKFLMKVVEPEQSIPKHKYKVEFQHPLPEHWISFKDAVPDKNRYYWARYDGCYTIYLEIDDDNMETRDKDDAEGSYWIYVPEPFTIYPKKK